MYNAGILLPPSLSGPGPEDGAAGGSHVHCKCHLAWDRLKQARAWPTMDVLTSVHAVTKRPELQSALSSTASKAVVSFRCTVIDLPGKGRTLEGWRTVCGPIVNGLYPI